MNAQIEHLIVLRAIGVRWPLLALIVLKSSMYSTVMVMITGKVTVVVIVPGILFVLVVVLAVTAVLRVVSIPVSALVVVAVLRVPIIIIVITGVLVVVISTRRRIVVVVVRALPTWGVLARRAPARRVPGVVRIPRVTAAFLSAAATSLVLPASPSLTVVAQHPVAMQPLVRFREAHGSVDDLLPSVVTLCLGILIIVGSRGGCRGSVTTDLGVDLENSAVGL
jgi:hypothetical protein